MDKPSKVEIKTETETKTDNVSSANDTAPGTAQVHLGSCHCGAVRFQVKTALVTGGRCNCSICTELGQLGVIVKPEAFTLLAGQDNLSSYEWGGRTAQRYFCKTCGVHCFAHGNLPQLGGAYTSVNYNCLDDVELVGLPVIYWDGRHDNWQAGPRPTPWPILGGAGREGSAPPPA